MLSFAHSSDESSSFFWMGHHASSNKNPSSHSFESYKCLIMVNSAIYLTQYWIQICFFNLFAIWTSKIHSTQCRPSIPGCHTYIRFRRSFSYVIGSLDIGLLLKDYEKKEEAIWMMKSFKKDKDKTVLKTGRSWMWELEDASEL